MSIALPEIPSTFSTESNIISTIPLPVDQQITITLAIRRPTFNGLTLKDYADGVMAGKYPVLTRDEFASKFAATDQDLELINQFAKNNNLTVIDLHAPGAMVILSGTVGSFNSALGITLNSVTTTYRTYQSYSGTINLPEELVGIILAAPGLDQSLSFKPHLSTQGTNNSSSFPVQTLTPPQVTKAYKFPAGGASGQCIAIAEIGGGYSQANLTSSFTNAGLPMPMVVDGNLPASLGGVGNDTTSGSAGETMLDIFVAGGAAPNAKIVVYFGSDGQDYNLFNYIVHDTVNNPSVISFSYGEFELIPLAFQNLAADRRQTESVFQAAASMGITICVSTGDSGTFAYPNDPATYPLTVNWPAISPYVLACGGTSLQLNSNGDIGFESVWNDPTSPSYGSAVTSGSSGGYSTWLANYDLSTNYRVQSWQSGLTIKQNPSGTVSALPARGIPDVAANADSRTGYLFYYGANNSQIAGGGTSAAAPLWAAAIATINAVTGKKVGFINNLLYSNPQLLNDITVGNNCMQVNGTFSTGYEATVGWDACTGLGSPNVTAIANLLSTPSTSDVSQTVVYNTTNNNINLSVAGAYTSASVHDQASQGTATASGSTILYTPNSGYIGIDSFTYTVSNTHGTSNISTVSITVLPPAPVTNSVNQTVSANSVNDNITLNVTGNYTSVAVNTQPTHGTAAANGTNITYTPNSGYFGTDSFTYTAVNTSGVSNVSTITITILPPPPVANPVSQTVGFNSVSDNISLNVTGPYTNVAVSTQASNGLATANNSTISYTPNHNYFGSDSFAYTASNMGGTSTAATVTLTILSPPPPVVNTVNQIVFFDSTNNIITLSISGTYTNVIIGSQPINGFATVTNKTILYTPNTGYSGPDSFTYEASNIGGTSTVATATITVLPPPPLTVSVNQSVGFNTISNNISLNVSGTYTSITAVSQPVHGSVTLNNNTISYTANNNYAGLDSFTYSATGIGGTSNVSTATITVLPPVLISQDINKNITYNSANNIITPIVNYIYSNVAIVSQPINGTASITGTNIVYVPTSGHYGSDSIKFTVSYAGSTSNTATVNITINEPVLSIFPTFGNLAPAITHNPYFPITFSASGGTGPYSFSVTNGSLPSGFTLNSGVLSGTTLDSGTYNFTITASDQSAPVPASQSKRYTLLVYNQVLGELQWLTPSGLLSTLAELTPSYAYPLGTGTNVTYSLISGALPSGLHIDSHNGTISGIPEPVINTTTSEFVLRIKDSYHQVRDRVFSINVVGGNAPAWVTPAGYLSVGVNHEYYAINNQYINYQLVAQPTLAPANTQLNYYIADNSGQLPPGITLNQNGLLSGYVRDKLISGTTSYPKIYEFIATASDNVVQSTQTFKIVVTNMDILENAPSLMPSDIALPSFNNYIQSPQWISGNNLGIIRAGHEHDIGVQAYDPNPQSGTLKYALQGNTGTNIYNQLPTGLTLDSVSGHIFGYVPYQPFYSEQYSFTVNVVKTNASNTQAIFVPNTFNLTVKGQIENDMAWVTDSDLGSITAGYVSELYVAAKHSTSVVGITYSLVSGTLPPGLSLQQDGSISGRADYSSSTSTYSFTVLATDIYKLNQISKTFNISVIFLDNLEYDQIYVRPFLSIDARSYYGNFINNGTIFDPNLIYRYFDTNFGIQPNIKMNLEFGIEKVDIDEYFSALQQNFYRRRLYFGDVKTAIAQDSTGTTVYEVVYVDIVDDMVNSAGQSVSAVVYTNNGDNVYYPSSIENMQNQLQSISLPDQSYIKVDEYQLPRFMRTPQTGQYQIPGFMAVVILCYALPGQSVKIVNKIKQSGFDFKLIDFEIDRLVVQYGPTESNAKYMIMPRTEL
jgi:subtilase family serine protease